MSDILEQMKDRTFEQYQLELTYIMPDGSVEMGFSPLLQSSNDYPILLVSEKGQTMIADGKFNIDAHPEFEWARKALSDTRSDLHKLSILGPKEGCVWQAFQQQGGWLGICEKGCALTLRDALTENKNITSASNSVCGSSLNMAPIIGINASATASDGHLETLLHEMTHNIHDTIHPFQETPAFHFALDFERTRGSSIVSNLDKTMQHFIKNGAYKQSEVNQELLCRLHEEKISNPEKFAQNAPILNTFFEKMMYPTIQYHLDGNQEAKQIMTDAMQMDFMCGMPLYGTHDKIKETKEKRQKILDEYYALKGTPDEKKSIEKLQAYDSQNTIPTLSAAKKNFNTYATNTLNEATDEHNLFQKGISNTLKKLQEREKQIKIEAPPNRLKSEIDGQLQRARQTAFRKLPTSPDHALKAWRKSGSYTYNETAYNKFISLRAANRKNNDGH